MPCLRRLARLTPRDVLRFGMVALLSTREDARLQHLMIQFVQGNAAARTVTEADVVVCFERSLTLATNGTRCNLLPTGDDLQHGSKRCAGHLLVELQHVLLGNRLSSSQLEDFCSVLAIDTTQCPGASSDPRLIRINWQREFVVEPPSSRGGPPKRVFRLLPITASTKPLESAEIRGLGDVDGVEEVA